jgi:hypothetical protein
MGQYKVVSQYFFVLIVYKHEIRRITQESHQIHR